MKVTQKHINMFNAGEVPSANENVVKLTGYSREIYFTLRDVKDSKFGCCGGRITLGDVKKYS